MSMKVISLCECEKNKDYIVQKVEGESVGVSRRLSELGFCTGAKVRVSCFSALKNTILVELEGYALSLRSSIANGIKVLEAKT